jgi:hypothetical protein
MNERYKEKLRIAKIEAENVAAAALIFTGGVAAGLTLDHFYHEFYDGSSQCDGVDFDGHSDLCGLYKRQLKALVNFKDNNALSFMGVRMSFYSYVPASIEDQYFVLQAEKQTGEARFYVEDIFTGELKETSSLEGSLGEFWRKAIERHLKFEDAYVGYNAVMTPEQFTAFMKIVAAHSEELNFKDAEILGIEAAKGWSLQGYIFCDTNLATKQKECGIYVPLNDEMALGYYSWLQELDYFEDTQSPVVTLGERHFRNLSESERQILDAIVATQAFDY